MSAITTHVLDTSRGCPAEGVKIQLERLEAGGAWHRIGSGATDANGRLRTLIPDGQALVPGVYRIVFDTAAYFATCGVTGFYPEVPVLFHVRDASQHYHVPLLLSPFGYSTYRGS
ncbi:MAG TPA: hydroxyisourate hydrolase [Polyangia bacterium]|jgi:5-hydroxyisourate hydrolase|nr:hydroxyisourate hydrolase [Polyangia bacterium]